MRCSSDWVDLHRRCGMALLQQNAPSSAQCKPSSCHLLAAVRLTVGHGEEGCTICGIHIHLLCFVAAAELFILVWIRIYESACLWLMRKGARMMGAVLFPAIFVLQK